MDEPLLGMMGELTTPAEGEALLRGEMPPWQKSYTSDDYTEYTWHAPTVRLYVGRCLLEAPRPGYEYPAWVYNALGGYPATIDPTVVCAAKTVGATIVDLIERPDALERARTEFRDRTGGGIGTAGFRSPEGPAPIDTAGPSTTTPRGEEWWDSAGA
jgi:aminobenzoyl-glutamate utilization protein B